MTNATALPRLLAEDEDALLSGWLQSQKKSGALRGGQISETDSAKTVGSSSPLCAKVPQPANLKTSPPRDGIRLEPCSKRCRALAQRSA